MAWYKNFKLIEDSNGYTLEIYLDMDSTEFSAEFMDNLKENILLLDKKIGKLIDEEFKDVKISSVKLMIGAMLFTTIPLVSIPKAEAATTSTAQTTSVTALNTTGTVTATKLNVRSGPSTSYSIIHVLWQGNRVSVIGESGSWYKIKLSDGRTGWVSKSYLQISSTRQQKINTVINTAKSLIGTPYVWGGESPAEGGFDCSGFTQYIFKQSGFTLNRISADQAKQGVAVSRANIEPGDLIFYDLNGSGTINHVGIYIGNGTMIHSPKAGDTVKYTNITTSYWESRFKTARRIF